MDQQSRGKFLETVQQGAFEQVQQRLLADPELAYAENDAGVSALLLAVYQGKAEIARLIQASRAAADEQADLNIFEAAALGDLERVETLVVEQPDQANAFSPDGFQPLGLAVFFGHSEVAAYLIAFGAHVNSRSQNAQRVYPLNSAAAAGNLSAVRLLLANGAQVDSRQAGDFTPLHSAAQNGQYELVELLVFHGADPQARDANGHTPADLAREAGHPRVVELLDGSV